MVVVAFSLRFCSEDGNEAAEYLMPKWHIDLETFPTE